MLALYVSLNLSIYYSFNHLAVRDEILPSDYCVTNKLGPLRMLILPFRGGEYHICTWAFRFSKQGIDVTTFMDCCLRTRASNVVWNEVDYLGGID